MKVQVYVDGQLLIDDEATISKLHDGMTELHVKRPIVSINGYERKDYTYIVMVPKRLKDTCDYAHLPHSGGGIDHGPATHNLRGYVICDKCYNAIIEAERKEAEYYR